MKIFVLLISLVVIVHAGTTQEQPAGKIFNGVYHNEEVLLNEDVDRPHYLDVDRQNNILYFSSYAHETRNIYTETSKLDLSTKEVEDIKGVFNGFAQSVDHASQNVYIGGGPMIYKYDNNLNKLEMMFNVHETIWNVYFKDDLYFGTYPTLKFYVYKNGTWNQFADLGKITVQTFLIDRENVMFYSNSTGFYSQQKGTEDVVVYNIDPLSLVTGLYMDNNGKLYVSGSDGIYTVNKDKLALEKVLDLPGVQGVTFDASNNLIYSDNNRIYRLTPKARSRNLN